jgi:chromosome segregation ATPase
MREKDALVNFLAEMKKKKLQLDARSGKKKREVDSAIVQTIEMEKKLQTAANTNRMMAAELAGLRKENEKYENDVEDLRKCLAEGTEKFEAECSEVERVKRMLQSYRKEINAEAKNRDNVQQDLRASRTAQNLMINRLDDMAKRNQALKRCVANTFNN